MTLQSVERLQIEGVTLGFREAPLEQWFALSRTPPPLEIVTSLCWRGYYGGWVDGLIMRLADVVMAFPSLVLIITIAAVIGPSIYNVMLVIGLLGWPPIARIVRGMFLSLRKREFVVAARASGVIGTGCEMSSIFAVRRSTPR